MAVVVLDGSTVRNFVNDESHFNKSIDDAFASLDLNNDGVLSRSELRKAFETLRLIETHFGVDVATTPEQLTQLYDSIFEQFDCDKSGTVDAEEFRTEMKNILLAIADGLGSSPIQMALDDGDQSFLKQAADLEASKLRQSSTWLRLLRFAISLTFLLIFFRYEHVWIWFQNKIDPYSPFVVDGMIYLDFNM